MQHLDFPKDSPFYNMVMSFTISLLGFKSFSQPGNPMKWKPREALRLEGMVSEPLDVNFHQFYTLIQNGHLDQKQHFTNLACMLINSAYETVKERNDQSPEFEFFRHIRNAASHGNKFYFEKHEPKRQAHWRGKVIDEKMKGPQNPLFDVDCFFHFIAVPDAILLLKDIEKKI